MKLFHVIVLGIFLALAVGAVIIFATFTSLNKNSVGSVSIWGSIPQATFDTLLVSIKEGNTTYDGVSYRSIPEGELIPALVEAIAAGQGPDLVVFPAENLISQSDKLTTIPYSNISRRDFQNTFIQAGEVFLVESGLKAIPFSVDPLVMYWNRTLFANAGIAQPPRFWDELSDMATRLTKAQDNGTLTQNAVALGTWDNVDHAKAIFLTLAYQLGNSVVVRSGQGLYVSVMKDTAGGSGVPSVDSALRFYTDFADPVKPIYSWNRSQPESRSAFLGEKLGVYFGSASELVGIREANPNLNFDVAPVPTIRGNNGGVAAELTGLAIPRGSRNPGGALLIAELLTSPDLQASLLSLMSLPSVRRDSVGTSPNDPYGTMFENAALLSFAFLDPDPTATDSIFKRMVEGVSSGKLQVSEATGGANDELQALLGTP
ncbi:MAG: extracellular solute-binding protein [Patescibacteria group bacterium]